MHSKTHVMVLGSRFLYLMLQLASNITIGNYQFYYVHQVKVKSSWKAMTDTANIYLPRNLKTKDNLLIDQVVKMGDPVNIQLGYVQYTVAGQPMGAGLVQRFAGYVSQAPGAATAICEIFCEDEMWKLKQGSFSKGWKNASLDDIITYIQQQTNATWTYEILGSKITLGAFKIEKCSPAKVLLALKDNYGLYSWFKPGQPANAQILQIGKPYDPNPANWVTQSFAYGRNVISWKDLQFKRATEVLLKATVKNHLPNGKVVEITVGDANGEERTLDFFNVQNTPQLKYLANELLAKMKYDGYRGHFPAFGEPVCFHGYVAAMSSYRYPERNGSFFIDAVDLDFKVASYRQYIALGPQAVTPNT